MAKITIKDIAEAAGVSPGTVDRVLHNRGKVAKDAERKVKDTITRLNYQPNLAARALASKRDFKIAILLPNQGEDEFWISQAKGVKRALKSVKDFGFSGDIFSFNDRKQGDILQYADDIFNGGYEAILIAPTLRKDSIEFMKKCSKLEIPYVQINTSLDTNDTYSLGYVGQDSFRSGLLAGKLLDLTSSNKPTLGVLHMESDVKNSSHMTDKEKGFISYFKNNTDVEVIIENLDYIENKKKLTKQIEDILSQHPSLAGLFITTSRVHHVSEILRSMNRSDIVLVGFDIIPQNIKALNNYKKLFLINQNPSLQGFYGVRRLFEYLMENKSIKTKKYLPLDVVTLENVSNYLHIQDRDNIDPYA